MNTFNIKITRDQQESKYSDTRHRSKSDVITDEQARTILENNSMSLRGLIDMTGCRGGDVDEDLKRRVRRNIIDPKYKSDETLDYHSTIEERNQVAEEVLVSFGKRLDKNRSSIESELPEKDYGYVRNVFESVFVKGLDYLNLPGTIGKNVKDEIKSFKHEKDIRDKLVKIIVEEAKKKDNL